jgi:hypothetical protein
MKEKMGGVCRKNRKEMCAKFHSKARKEFVSWREMRRREDNINMNLIKYGGKLFTGYFWLKIKRGGLLYKR